MMIFYESEIVLWGDVYNDRNHTSDLGESERGGPFILVKSELLPPQIS